MTRDPVETQLEHMLAGLIGYEVRLKQTDPDRAEDLRLLVSAFHLFLYQSRRATRRQATAEPGGTDPAEG